MGIVDVGIELLYAVPELIVEFALIIGVRLTLLEVVIPFGT